MVTGQVKGRLCLDLTGAISQHPESGRKEEGRAVLRFLKRSQKSGFVSDSSDRK